MGERIHIEVEQGPGPRRGPPPGRGSAPVALLLPGIAFLGMGVVVLVVPEIITYMVAGIFFVIGLALVVAARRVRRWKRALEAFRNPFAPP
jgi:Flp pilus assembly protein TadB